MDGQKRLELSGVEISAMQETTTNPLVSTTLNLQSLLRNFIDIVVKCIEKDWNNDRLSPRLNERRLESQSLMMSR